MLLHARMLAGLGNFVISKGDLRTYRSESGKWFFCESSPESKTVIEVPLDLSLREFADLDSSDFEKLKAFQERFGLISSPYRNMPSLSNHLSHFNDGTKLLILNYFEDEINACKYSNQMWLEYSQWLSREHGDAILSINNMHDWPKDETFPIRANFSSMDEVSQTVSNVQHMVKATSAVKMGSHSETDEEMASLFSSIISDMASQKLPFFQYVIDVSPDEDTHLPNSEVTLIEALMFNHALSLVDSETFKTCENPECGRVFQYKKGGRRAGSRYCCDECQLRAKRLRQNQREKKSRKENKDQTKQARKDR